MFHNCTTSKKSQRKMFSNKDAKIGHFHCFPDVSCLSQHDESWALGPELFKKKLLIIKVIINSDCFSQNRSMKSAFEILHNK